MISKAVEEYKIAFAFIFSYFKLSETNVDANHRYISTPSTSATQILSVDVKGSLWAIWTEGPVGNAFRVFVQWRASKQKRMRESLREDREDL